VEETLNPSSTKTAGPVEGAMFLYERPELLTVEDHAGLGLSAVARPFDFVRKVRGQVWVDTVPIKSGLFGSHRLLGSGNRSSGVDRVR
jgi:hypothetical protein